MTLQCLGASMNVVLISTYELGHQPFGLASPAAWLRARGHQVVCFDLSREALRDDAIRRAGFIAFYVPMHTATRLAARLIENVQCLNPGAHLCVYGLYAPVNEAYFRSLGVQTILGGEFEDGLVRAVESGATSAAGETISLERLRFILPDRAGLPALKQYAHLVLPDGTSRVAGYTEASRGCKHLCRHCPIVPVYKGVFRIVPREVVLGDIRQQVAAGATHITFGDPDFLNGPAHAMAIVEELHREFPAVTYDVTIKVEHLLKHSHELRVAARFRLPVRHHRGRIGGRRRARAARQGAHPRRFSGRRESVSRAGHRAAADLRALHAVDHAGELSRFAFGHRCARV